MLFTLVLGVWGSSWVLLLCPQHRWLAARLTRRGFHLLHPRMLVPLPGFPSPLPRRGLLPANSGQLRLFMASQKDRFGGGCVTAFKLYFPLVLRQIEKFRDV